MTALEKKYQDIKDDYAKLSGVKEHGTEKYTHDWIVNKLALDYYLKPTTIHNIVTGYYATKVPKAIYKNRNSNKQSTKQKTQCKKQTKLFGE